MKELAVMKICSKIPDLGKKFQVQLCQDSPPILDGLGIETMTTLVCSRLGSRFQRQLRVPGKVAFPAKPSSIATRSLSRNATIRSTEVDKESVNRDEMGGVLGDNKSQEASERRHLLAYLLYFMRRGSRQVEVDLRAFVLLLSRKFSLSQVPHSTRLLPTG